MTNTDLKIAIVHEFLTKLGGAEQVLLVLHKMFRKAPIYTLVYDKEGTKSKFADCNIATSSLNKYPAKIKNYHKLLLPYCAKAIEEFDFSEFDIVISSSNSFAHGVITSPKTFHLCYCHSPMRYAWDYTNEYLKENKIGFGPKGLLVRKILHEVRIWDKASSYRVDKWIANSKNVQKRIKKYYGFDSDVLFPPIPIEAIESSENIPDDFYLIVSRLEPYKKVDLAIRAFNELKKPLVIIGVGSEEAKLKQIAKENIEFLGWQSTKSVYEYMRNAKALIFPGEDDAGITPIESMACGRPVIAYGKGGVIESVTNETGAFFDEQTPESLAEKVVQFEAQITTFTGRKCRENAEKFSEENFIAHFQELLNKGYEEYTNKMN